MTIEEKLLKIAEKLLADKQARETVKQKYKDKEKTKALTTAERLTRIEEILGIT